MPAGVVMLFLPRFAGELIDPDHPGAYTGADAEAALTVVGFAAWWR
jgi:hypothetical protein